MLVAEVMTSHPLTLPATETAERAAQLMRDHNVGDVLVVDDAGQLRGIVTDRDIAVRGVAEGQNPNKARLDDLCSHDVTTVDVMEGAEQATQIMRDHAVRRVPVVDSKHRVVGVVSIGDLARQLDADSVLADISTAPPNT